MPKKHDKNNNSDFDVTVSESKKSRRKGVVLSVILVLVLACVGLYFCTTKLFFVQSLDIKDITDEYERLVVFPYTEDEMLEGLGIEKGIGLYDFNAGKAEKNAKFTLPYIEDISVSRRWPDTVTVKAVVELPAYYVAVGNDLYIIADSLKVLEKTRDFERIELYSLIRLDCSSIHSCIVGEKLGIPDDIEEIILELYDNMNTYNVAKDVTGIDVSDKFNVSLMYRTRYTVKLGDTKSLGVKIEFMKRIIEDRVDEPVGGIIDVSDEKNREAVYKKFG